MLEGRIKPWTKLAVYIWDHGLNILVELKGLRIVEKVETCKFETYLKHYKFTINEAHGFRIVSKLFLSGKYLNLRMKVFLWDWVLQALISHPLSKFFGKAVLQL